jgi:hypothetical protein
MRLTEPATITTPNTYDRKAWERPVAYPEGREPPLPEDRILVGSVRSGSVWVP